MDDYESLNYDKDKLRAACKLPAFPRHQCMMGWPLAARAITNIFHAYQSMYFIAYNNCVTLSGSKSRKSAMLFDVTLISF